MGINFRFLLIRRLYYSRPVRWAVNHRETTGVLLILSAMMMVAAIRLFQFRINSAPPGSDGGQWLAFGYQLFGGEQVRAGFQAYPPVFPFLVRIIALHDGLLTLKLLGISSLVLVCAPVYLLLRTALHPWLAAALAITVSFTPYQSEVLSFGGYPQLLGTAFLMFAVFFLLWGLNTGQRRFFIGAAAFSAGIAGSNVLPTMALIMATGMVLLFWYFLQIFKDRSCIFKRTKTLLIWWAVPSVLLSLGFYSTYWDYFMAARQFGISQRDLPLTELFDRLLNGWRLEFILWSSLFAVFVVVLFFASRKLAGKHSVLMISSLATLLCGLAGVFLIRELRFGSFVEIGLVLALGLLISMLLPNISSSLNRKRLLLITIVTVFLAVSVIGLTGERRFRIAYGWYSVLDNTAMPALEWLRDHKVSGAKVAATNSERGNIYGWWIEGYVHMQTLMYGNPRLFIGVRENDQVAYAKRLLMEDTGPEVIRQMAERENISYLFIDVRAISHSIDSFLAAGFIKVFENGPIIIMSNR